MKAETPGTRLSRIEELPTAFTVSELRRHFAVTPDVARHLLRVALERALIEGAGRGFYLRCQGRRPEQPLVMHWAAAANPGSYFTGLYALAHHRVVRERPSRLDLVVRERPGPNLAWDGCTLRRVKLGLVDFTPGLDIVRDGNRELRVATPERVLLDALGHPGKFLTIAEVAHLFKEGKKRLRQTNLLDLTLKFGSEAVFRRLRIMAEHAGMARLGRWLQEEGGLRTNMGHTRLDPGQPVPPGTASRFGVLLNVPLASTGLPEEA